MMERSTRASPARATDARQTSSHRAPEPALRPDDRRTQATKRSLSMRSTLWGALTLVLIAFLAWFVFWANETGGMLP